MKHARQWSLSLVAALAAAVLVYRPQSAFDVPAAAVAPTLPPHARETISAVETWSAINTDASRAHQLRLSEDLRGALETARRQLDPDAPQLYALNEEVRVACAIARRPDASAARVEADPNRRIWIDQLLRRCAGLLDADLAPPVESPRALSLRNALSPEMVAAFDSEADAERLSLGHVRTSIDADLITSGLRFLLEHQKLPLQEIFKGVVIPAQADLDAALLPASDWVACARSNACSYNGLWTLYTCAQFGCPAGSDLPRALERMLPIEQFEAAQRIAQWALAQH